MSYDVELEMDDKSIVGDFNYTYNVSEMFAKAIGSSITIWDGKSAVDVSHDCEKILIFFIKYPAMFRAMNPENGWGDFEGARNFIIKIKDACDLNPGATVRVG